MVPLTSIATEFDAQKAVIEQTAKMVFAKKKTQSIIKLAQ